MASLLDGFRLIELKEKVEESTLTITAKALKFNRGTARDLGCPSKIRFYVSDKMLQLAVIPTKADDEDGVDFAFDENSREAPIYVKEPAVLDAVKKIAVQENDGQTVNLLLKGKVYLEERTIIYDLTEAQVIPVKSRGRRKLQSKEK